MSMRYALAIIPALILWACQPATMHVVRLPNGEILQQWTEKPGSDGISRREGLFQSFLKDGRPESAIEYHDGRKNGAARIWAPAGWIRFQGKYQDDFLIREIRLDAQGRTILDETNRLISASRPVSAPWGDSILTRETCAWIEKPAGKLLRNGLCNLDYGDGKPFGTLYYRYGKLQGPIKTWYADGKPWMEGAYDQDRPAGKWRAWSSTGNPLWSSAYMHGKKIGPSQEWYPNGKIRLRTEYREGVREGEEMAWYPDGGKFYAARYAAGKLESDFYQWYPGGRLRLHCRFQAGKREGSSRVWYRDGHRLEKAEYLAGHLDGPYRAWSPDGALLSSKVYRKGSVAYDSKAQELMELLGINQRNVPLGILGFYWGMPEKDCRANLSLLQAQGLGKDNADLVARLTVFPDRHPTKARVRLQFNSQAELWGIKLDLQQNNSAGFFALSENLEREMGCALGASGMHRTDGKSKYFLTQNKSWGTFTFKGGKENDSAAVITRVLPVISAESYSPGDAGWYRFSLANHLYREYADPANISITPPRWTEEAVLAGR